VQPIKSHKLLTEAFIDFATANIHCDKSCPFAAIRWVGCSIDWTELKHATYKNVSCRIEWTPDYAQLTYSLRTTHAWSSVPVPVHPCTALTVLMCACGARCTITRSPSTWSSQSSYAELLRVHIDEVGPSLRRSSSHRPVFYQRNWMSFRQQSSTRCRVTHNRTAHRTPTSERERPTMLHVWQRNIPVNTLSRKMH
jgi:hypothetical protein